jgi:RHS repeat-associated protein
MIRHIRLKDSVLTSNRFIYSGMDIIASIDEINGNMVYFTRGTGNAPGVGDVIAEIRICSSLTQTFFYIKNHRGDTIALVNEAGTAVGTYQYDAWGQVTVQEGTNAWFTFSSKRYDPDAKLYYYGFRWYDPESKRWTQPDPSGIAEGLDLYRFCDNDPVNGVDVYGEWVVAADIGRWWQDKLDYVKSHLYVTENSLNDVVLNYAIGHFVDTMGGGLGLRLLMLGDNWYDRYQYNVCDLGNNKFWAVLDTANLVAGDIVGYTPFLEGCVGVDRASGNLLPTDERWVRGVSGGVQMVLFTVGAAEGLHFVRGKYFAPKTTAVQKYYPDNNGFIGNTKNKTLMPGEVIDRYGGTQYSRFFSPENTPMQMRSLPPGTAVEPLHAYKILKPLEVQSGTVAPAYGQLGLGTQYRTPVPLGILLKRGIIKKLY